MRALGWFIPVALMLLLFLVASVVAGAVRKLRGGSFLPPPGSEGEHHFKDKEGRWWRVADDGSLEEAFRRTKKRR
jgi:hypothetical protein